MEADAIAKLFSNQLPTITEPLQGAILNNTLPSSWGVLNRNGKIIAVAYLQSNLDQSFSPFGTPYGEQSSRYHSGPAELLSN
ncbi:hypothetical protein [Leptothoe sp. PORK10 BA2]|uniref:hypothetical protein n=1 Tax=Leptothoe sp. PORK10 BA2 TaxID=3110254 RepID=UPI002B1F8D78|nr:hypothetical protein [Leptothoe sp. PORK10 BA2]MEA5464812.1 hypothetical protein [Leptothoe sp. PORK10 BA2]